MDNTTYDYDRSRVMTAYQYKICAFYVWICGMAIMSWIFLLCFDMWKRLIQNTLLNYIPSLFLNLCSRITHPSPFTSNLNNHNWYHARVWPVKDYCPHIYLAIYMIHHCLCFSLCSIIGICNTIQLWRCPTSLVWLTVSSSVW